MIFAHSGDGFFVQRKAGGGEARTGTRLSRGPTSPRSPPTTPLSCGSGCGTAKTAVIAVSNAVKIPMENGMAVLRERWRIRNMGEKEETTVDSSEMFPR